MKYFATQATKLARTLHGFLDPAAPLSAPDRDLLRARQIGAVLALSPAMVFANGANWLIILWLFGGGRHNLFLAVWSGVLFLALGYWFWRWRSVARTKRERASTRGTRRIIIFTTLFALLWAAPMLFLFADASDPQRAVLAASEAGMLSGGALALATIWQAMLIYCVIIEISCLAEFIGSGDAAYLSLAALTLMFATVIAAVASGRGRLFVEAFLANHEVQEKSNVISLLLREFEANASDWLFEVDAAARLVRVSERLVQVLGEPLSWLEGRGVATYLSGVGGGVRTAPRSSPLGRLLRAFLHREAFRDIVIPVVVHGEERIWSLSGRALFERDGAFRGYLGVGSDVTEAHRAEASIRRMANFDSLTGLPNRSLLHAHLDAALERTQRDGDGFALISLDLDRFKQVNDTLGHGVGDRLLIEVGKRISAQLADDDVAARFGGDEFVVLQPRAEFVRADGLARRLVSALSENYQIAGHRINIGASAGIALAPKNGASGEDLLRNSDLALYRAKADGRGLHRFFSAKMHADSQARRRLELDLREALQAGAIDVHFQPLVDIHTAHVDAFEALARWTHPVNGEMAPAQFIPVAEETGLIFALGAFVLRRACEAAVGWRSDIRVAVNLSVVQFKTDDLVAVVERTLAEVGLRPERLELEITESVLIEDRHNVMRRLAQLRALGVRIALDDFGTGFSSLSYLSSFPFDKIKIDRSFVRNVAERPDAAAIVGAINKLAGTLGICATAEGVETQAEFEWLRDNGCHQVQGYFVGAPQPAEALALLFGPPRAEPDGASRAA